MVEGSRSVPERSSSIRAAGRTLLEHLSLKRVDSPRKSDWFLGVGLFAFCLFFGNPLRWTSLGEHLFTRVSGHVLVYAAISVLALAYSISDRGTHPFVRLLLIAPLFFGAFLSILAFILLLPQWTLILWILVMAPYFAPILLIAAAVLVAPLLPAFSFVRAVIRNLGIAEARYGVILPSLAGVLILSVMLALAYPYLTAFPPWRVLVQLWLQSEFGLFVEMFL